MLQRILTTAVLVAMSAGIGLSQDGVVGDGDSDVVRVFIFAGQSNMVGSDSRASDIARFPPFHGVEKPQESVRFSYCLGRENKTQSEGWVSLHPVNNVVGPELSFARKVRRHAGVQIAIIKVAAGGTHLGGDWNPDNPEGFRMYPLALKTVRESLAELDRQNIRWRLEGFMWHQGENDMFNAEYMKNYGANLKNYLACWRRDLKAPKLKFYIGELCTKTIWGMDLRPRMYAISQGQRSVTDEDPLAEYVPTSHVGVEIGNPVGLHYHYGTLGQLEHGENYADAYLRTIGKTPPEPPRHVAADPRHRAWPFKANSKVRLFVLAGHRNMEGERAFIQELQGTQDKDLLREEARVPFRYSIGGGYRTSQGWELLRPAGYYDTFGPELSFVRSLRADMDENIAIVKFTHSGSQMNDWTPQGSAAKSRHVYPDFIRFVRESMAELSRHHDVELAGVFYHVGENEMSMPPYRRKAAEWLQSLIQASRNDLGAPKLKWFVSQQRPTDHKNVNGIDVVREISDLADSDPDIVHIRAFNPPPQPKRLVLDTPGIVWLGELLAKTYLESL